MHPPCVEVTVNISAVPGLTVTVVVVALPAFILHVQVATPLAVNCVLDPEQIAEGEALTVMLGVGFTVRAIDVESKHPPLEPIKE